MAMTATPQKRGGRDTTNQLLGFQQYLSNYTHRVAKPSFHEHAAKHLRGQQITARAAKPTTHFFIHRDLSRIRTPEFASILINDFSISAQTLINNSPSLVPSQVPPWSTGRQRFPR
jgi:hypothetical protein